MKWMSEYWKLHPRKNVSQDKPHTAALFSPRENPFDKMTLKIISVTALEEKAKLRSYFSHNPKDTSVPANHLQSAKNTFFKAVCDGSMHMYKRSIIEFNALLEIIKDNNAGLYCESLFCAAVAALTVACMNNVYATYAAKWLIELEVQLSKYQKPEQHRLKIAYGNRLDQFKNHPSYQSAYQRVMDLQKNPKEINDLINEIENPKKIIRKVINLG